jgi:hypothetical protein
MKKMFSVLFILTVIPGCSWFWARENKVVGSGTPLQETRTVSDFDEIVVNGQGVLILKQGDQNLLSVEADDNLLAFISSEVRDNKLYIQMQDGAHLEPRTLIKYYVITKDIKEVALHGSAQLITEPITTQEFEIEATGEAKVDALVHVQKLKVVGTGSTKFNMSGSAQQQKLSFTDASIYNAADVISDKIEIESSGAVRVTINAQKELKAHISGASFIGYKGEPMLSIKQSGGASISKVG